MKKVVLLTLLTTFGWHIHAASNQTGVYQNTRGARKNRGAMLRDNLFNVLLNADALSCYDCDALNAYDAEGLNEEQLNKFLTFANSPEKITELVRLGANPNMYVDNDQSLLSVLFIRMLYSGFSDIAEKNFKALLASGANINLPTHPNKGPLLHEHAMYGMDTFVEIILGYGANAQTSARYEMHNQKTHGNTVHNFTLEMKNANPLHFFIMGCNGDLLANNSVQKTVKLLIDAGVDLTARTLIAISCTSITDNNPQTAVTMTKKYWLTAAQIIQYRLKMGVEPNSQDDESFGITSADGNASFSLVVNKPDALSVVLDIINAANN